MGQFEAAGCLGMHLPLARGTRVGETHPLQHAAHVRAPRQDILQALISLGLCTAYVVEIERERALGVRVRGPRSAASWARSLAALRQPSASVDATVHGLVAVANGFVALDFLWQLFLSRTAYASTHCARRIRPLDLLTALPRLDSLAFLTSTHAAVDAVSLVPFVVTIALGDEAFGSEGTALSLFPTLRLVPILRVHRVVPHLPSGASDTGPSTQGPRRPATPRPRPHTHAPVQTRCGWDFAC